MVINMEYYLTRMCKNIMKKLGTTKDTQFKSTIQCLMSSVLPLNHKSGLNISGRFSDQKKNIRIDKRSEVGEEVSDKEYAIYNNFWTLEQAIVHPVTLFTQQALMEF